ncbi:hypothetical protein DFH08DRAFT_820223 [Mycena albidolilacea]|uniref:Uncharacterized protein n=1 Tax=Mycena albidolilacea TaxID=1033008 RepID=A0AAD7EEF6_9AGAR|nr:hypothetical protein DFH08DRAFT_820223 [Mycena albidolilacea]
MALTTSFPIARDVDTPSPGAVLAPASSPSPFDNRSTLPNIPVWVAPIIGIVVFCAIVVFFYHTRKSSRAWEEQNALKSQAKKSEERRTFSQKMEKLFYGRAASTMQLPPPAHTAPIKESAAQNAEAKNTSSFSEKRVSAAITPPPPAYTQAAEADNDAPASPYALTNITRANTLKNQRREVQVFAKPPVVDEAPLSPILRPDGAQLERSQLHDVCGESSSLAHRSPYGLHACSHPPRLVPRTEHVDVVFMITFSEVEWSRALKSEPLPTFWGMIRLYRQDGSM